MKNESVIGDMKLTLGAPVIAGEGVGHYWFPFAANRFPTGEVLVRCSLNADSADNLVNGVGHILSTDEGATWLFKYETTRSALLHFPRADGTIAGTLAATGYAGFADPPQQSRRVRSHYVILSNGGRSYTLEANTVFIEGFPRDLKRAHNGSRNRETPLCLTMNGDCVRLGAAILTTAYLLYEGEEKMCVVALESNDEGHTWRFITEIFSAYAMPDMVEGPNEASLVQLEDGDILCVARTGNGRYGKRPLIQSRSADGGRTWAPPRRIAPFSVWPCLRRLDNGVLALSTGRPGLFLWLCTDGRGDNWQPVDITAHHNKVMDAAHLITDGELFDGQSQTTSYTQVVPLAPDRLLYIYDRIPFGWKPVPLDSKERNRIYALQVKVERT
jgi:hypothetical protein